MKYSNLNLFLITIMAIFNTSCYTSLANSYNPKQNAGIQAQASLNNRPDFFEKGRFKMEQ